jgi:hypothetical protein
MADVNPTLSNSAGIIRTTWTGITSADTATAFTVQGYGGNVAAVQITGTFGGTTVTLQGSIDGSNYTTLKDIAGSNVSMSAAGLVDFRTAAVYIKPVCTGGAGYTITVTCVLRGK